jgi:hypothetical protein
MILGAENLTLFTGGPWSAVFFGIGLSALLWVFRRMILLRRRGAGDAIARQYRAQRDKAREQIGEIDERAWLSSYRQAAKICRERPLSPAQRRLLKELTARQQARSSP